MSIILFMPHRPWTAAWASPATRCSCRSSTAARCCTCRRWADPLLSVWGHKRGTSVPVYAHAIAPGLLAPRCLPTPRLLDAAVSFPLAYLCLPPSRIVLATLHAVLVFTILVPSIVYRRPRSTASSCWRTARWLAGCCPTDSTRCRRAGTAGRRTIGPRAAPEPTTTSRPAGLRAIHPTPTIPPIGPCDHLS